MFLFIFSLIYSSPLSSFSVTYSWSDDSVLSADFTFCANASSELLLPLLFAEDISSLILSIASDTEDSSPSVACIVTLDPSTDTLSIVPTTLETSSTNPAQSNVKSLVDSSEPSYNCPDSIFSNIYSDISP